MTRFGYAMVTYVGGLVVIGLAFIHPFPRLLWNATGSVPTGLYAVRPGRDLHLGDLAVIRPPEPIARYLAFGGYLPLGVPLVKPVAARPGQQVCRSGAALTVDGRLLGQALARDHRGRSLPIWQGCRIVAPGELFFMNPARWDSLDGRYFGPFPATSVLGRATPLWLSAAPHALSHHSPEEP